MNECNICFDEKVCFQPDYKCCIFKICEECFELWNETTSPVVKCPVCRNVIERNEIQPIEITTVNPIYIYVQPVRRSYHDELTARKINGMFICMGFLIILILLLLYPRD